MLTVTEVAQRLGVSPQRIRLLISQGRMPAQRVGPLWLIAESDAVLPAARPPGRVPQEIPEEKPRRNSKETKGLRRGGKRKSG